MPENQRVKTKGLVAGGKRGSDKPAPAQPFSNLRRVLEPSRELERAVVVKNASYQWLLDQLHQRRGSTVADFYDAFVEYRQKVKVS